MQHLIAQATQPLYLKCLKPQLVEFYTERGFVPVKFQNLQPSLKAKFGFSQLRKRLIKVFVMFMKYQYPN
jgi:amino-acid N-acetyltransferase